MSGEYIDILIFAMIAAFVFFRLRSVLGRRTGNERRPQDAFSGPVEREAARETNVLTLPEREREREAAAIAGKVAGTPLEAGLTQIKLADREFEPAKFVAGARAAFEMIVTAFAQGNLAKVKTFLAREVYDNFADALAARQRAQQTAETTVVGIKTSDIVEARMDGRNALVTVKFVSEQINVVRDKAGTVVEGDPSQVSDVTDIWTFFRDTRSRDPNWTLVETHSPN
jgi:predicted lipid-binding transport protein (Tim44 family)